MIKFGYALTWSLQDNIDLQVDRLRKEGCMRIFTEKVSSPKRNAARFIQVEFEKLLTLAQEGDVIMVCSLLNLGKDLAQLAKLIEQLKLRGIHLQSLKEPLDTNTPTGEMFVKLMNILVETQKSWRRENTLEGLIIARAKGKKGGRKYIGLTKQLQIIAPQIKKVHDSMMYSIETIREIFAIKNKAVFYQVLAYANRKEGVE